MLGRVQFNDTMKVELMKVASPPPSVFWTHHGPLSAGIRRSFFICHTSSSSTAFLFRAEGDERLLRVLLAGWVLQRWCWAGLLQRSRWSWTVWVMSAAVGSTYWASSDPLPVMTWPLVVVRIVSMPSSWPLVRLHCESICSCLQCVDRQSFFWYLFLSWSVSSPSAVFLFIPGPIKFWVWLRLEVNGAL